MMRLAQLSDTHLVAEQPGPGMYGINTAENLAAILDAFPVRPDAAVITGDVAEDGAVAAYEAARTITSDFAAELHVVPGNHDDRSNMVEVFGDVGPRMISLSRHWAMALVDSQWSGHGNGQIAPEGIAALDASLAHADGNVVVCLHHPPVSPCDDPYCTITNATEMSRVLRRHECVRVVLSGHLHRVFDTTVDGIRFLGAPSTFRQLEHGHEPHFRTTTEPPAARLVELHDDGTVTYRDVSAR
jgi:Icc protein